MTKNIVVEGKGGIRVEVVLHSISEAGKEIITFLVDHPRIVHAEELKHRQFSYSAASSRAIPSAKMAEQLTGMPVRFGQANAGMQDKGEDYAGNGNVKLKDWDGYDVEFTPQNLWNAAKKDAIKWSNAFAEAGYHKQVYNRLTEPFQMIRVLITATETDNFYWLRNDKAADPTLQEQARCMQEAHKLSKPQVLKAGQYHLPFVESLLSSDDSGLQYFYETESAVGTTNYLSLEDAIKVSCARCAATSFRNENYGLEKSLQVYDRLVNGDKVHAGALEHCATPMESHSSDYTHSEAYQTHINKSNESKSWQQGISHMDRDGNLWSGNFKSWIQYRKTIPNECYKKNA